MRVIGSLNAAAGLLAMAAAGPVIVVSDQEKGRPEPQPDFRPEPTAADLERQRLAAQRRARKMARQAKGFATLSTLPQDNQGA